jgi:hypothetical protein
VRPAAAFHQSAWYNAPTTPNAEADIRHLSLVRAFGHSRRRDVSALDRDEADLARDDFHDGNDLYARRCTDSNRHRHLNSLEERAR